MGSKLACRRRRPRKTLAIGASALVVLVMWLAAGVASAQTLDTSARNAIVIDAETGAVLLEKGADQRIPPASMSKLMTAAMVFEALKQGRLSLDERFSVSRNAFQKEGSTMFLNLTDRPRVEDLLRGVIVQSGNDACIVLAEGLAGSERAFSDLMTKRAREIGMESATFKNATGLPDPDHLMSVRDLATLANYIIAEFPEYYGYYSEREFAWAGVNQRNRNPLLALGIGGDGLKTGHTEEAGYGLVGSAIRDGRRIIAVVAGLSSPQERSREIERAINWAFREFRIETIGRAGEIVAEADVWLGDRARVPLALPEDLRVTSPWVARGNFDATLIYTGPVPAPIEAGQQIATLRVEVPGVGPVEAPLVAAEAVGSGGYFTRLMAGVGLLVDRIAAELRG